ncbi:ras-related protein Rab2BV-like [Macadamia integrifolia]|uniref:ras-related protein Rab2BV-like n=1 Tax=Macadamia integrifolia TaxID=60698 RepID=UPI001C4E3213|nr:ras-related protein Rab2BV-like [Macadamia integrifolia]
MGMADYDDQEFEYIFKTILIGDSAVGKSNLLSRFVWDRFRLDSRPTIGVEFAYWNTQVGDKLVKTQIWDTAGQERFRAFTSSYYRGAMGALLVYDITQRTSFNNLEKWLREIREYGDSDMVIMLVGNKTDMCHAREVSEEEGQRLAENEGLCFMETSALESFNVEEAFLQLIFQIYEVTSKKKLDAKSSQAQTITPTTGKKILHLDEVSADQNQHMGCCWR